jgi:hypothetical protein
MAKKDFGQGFDMILRNEEDPVKATPPSSEKSAKNILSLDKKQNKATKVTIRINDQLLFQLKELAYWDRKTLTEIISDALTTHIKSNIGKISN